MRLRIVPYKPGSASAKMIAHTLTDRLGYRVYSGRPRNRYMNILWGRDLDVPNAPQSYRSIQVAKNKVSTFRALKEGNISIPPFTTDKAEAETWINDEHTVFARHSLTASHGYGIEICESLPLPDAPLYVQYIKKKKEFRVHVFNHEAIDVQQKKRRRGGDANGMIRSYNNGWVFCRQDIVEPEGLRDIAVKAVDCLGLLFGAVDIIYNERQNKLYVLEVNTAPGLTETTANKYVDSILRLDH